MSTKFLLAAIAALALPSLAACGSTGGQELAYSAPDMFSSAVDPTDLALQKAIAGYLENNKGPKNSQYEYTRMDLNGDGLREGLVLFNLPHSYWCGWSGCTLAVFEAGDNSFRLVSETSRIRGPLMIGGSQTNGWEDIGVRLSGMGSADRNVLLKYNGEVYPENPLDQDSLPYDLASLGGTRVFP